MSEGRLIPILSTYGGSFKPFEYPYLWSEVKGYIPIKTVRRFLRRREAEGLVLNHINDLRRAVFESEARTLEQAISDFTRKERRISGSPERAEGWFLRQVRAAFVFAGRGDEVANFEKREIEKLKKGRSRNDSSGA